MRTDLKPLEITQPEGPSFDGRRATRSRWQNWRFGVGFNAREGLVLHTVGYEDGGPERSILYRASLAEMVVPYGDPGPTQRARTPSTSASTASACWPTASSWAATASA